MASARTGLPTRFDLCALGQIAAEAIDLLVVDQRGLVSTEGADLAAPTISVEVVTLAGTGGRHGRWFS
jgi:hypothetical protein